MNFKSHLEQLIFLNYQGGTGLIEWCMNKGLIALHYKCSCGSLMSIVSINDRLDSHQWRCHKESHDVKRSLRKGLWFENSHLSILAVLQITFYWIYNVPLSLIAVILQLNPNTITDWAMFCRETCIEIIINESTPLGGQGKIVEIDESKFGKRKFNRGKRVEGQWVFGWVERGSKKYFFRAVEKRGKEVLFSIIREYILPGTIIVSDCWKAYDCLKEDFDHLTVNHSVHLKDPETGAHTNSIESTWAAIKRQIPKNKVKDQFDSYLFGTFGDKLDLNPMTFFWNLLKTLRQFIPLLLRTSHHKSKLWRIVGCLDGKRTTVPTVLAQVRSYAARKGTREKARKKKVKVEIQKLGFVPHILREKQSTSKLLQNKRLNDDFKPLPIDDVFVSKYFRWKVYDFKEAVECHRELHHPEIYNQPTAPLHAFIELDMKTSKKTKFVDSFSRIAKVKHPFPQKEERSILVFCKTTELKEQAEAVGATLVGDIDLIKKVEKGDIVLPDFQFVVAHPNILPELVGLRGLLRKKFPNPRLGTLGTDIPGMIKSIKTGIQYWAYRDEVELDYGWLEAPIGKLDMKIKELEENLQALVEDISIMRPKRSGAFITRIMLKSPPSVEKLKLNLEERDLIEMKKDPYTSDSDNENEQPGKFG